MTPLRFGWQLLAAAACIASLLAQDDLRDVVRLKNGQEVRGRVFSRWLPTELIVMQGGKRLRLPHAQVVAIDTVRDRTREFFQLSDRLPDHARHRWFLAEWALGKGLVALAHLQAMDIVLREPDHAEAHTLLGHRLVGKRWLWPHNDEWRSFEDLERFHADFGHPWRLEGEHFEVRSNATLRRVVDTALDLERLYLWWHEEFGEELGLYEVVGTKLAVQVWRDRSSFNALSSDGHPYFQHRMEGTNEEARCSTYFVAESPERPTRLFEVATQHLLYRTLADDPALQNGHRYCGWGEVGLAQYVERRLGGAPGRAQPKPWSLTIDEGRLITTGNEIGLQNLTHRSVRQFHFVVANDTQYMWAAAHLFTAYLLDGDRGTSARRGFLTYLVQGLRGAKGDSSTTFDELLGCKIETLDRPWRKWLTDLMAAL